MSEDRKSVTHRGEPHIDSIEVGGDVTLYSNSAPSHALEEGAVHEDEDLRVDRGRHRGPALSAASSSSCFDLRIVVGCGSFDTWETDLVKSSTKTVKPNLM